MKHFATFILLFFLYSFVFSQKYCIRATYIPFSFESPVDISEENLANIKSIKNILQVKNDTIKNRKIIELILYNLPKSDFNSCNDFYDLRVRCIILNNLVPVDSFYFDRMKRLIYNGRIYAKDTLISNLVFNNLCKPFYTFLFTGEEKFWDNNSNCCNDSLEFFSIYGREQYENVKNFKKTNFSCP